MPRRPYLAGYDRKTDEYAFGCSLVTGALMSPILYSTCTGNAQNARGARFTSRDPNGCAKGAESDWPSCDLNHLPFRRPSGRRGQSMATAREEAAPTFESWKLRLERA